MILSDYFFTIRTSGSSFGLIIFQKWSFYVFQVFIFSTDFVQICTAKFIKPMWHWQCHLKKISYPFFDFLEIVFFLDRFFLKTISGWALMFILLGDVFFWNKKPLFIENLGFLRYRFKKKLLIQFQIQWSAKLSLSKLQDLWTIWNAIWYCKY